MFSSSAGRVARASTTPHAHSSTTSAVRSIAARSRGSGHQRRLSSSKASVPPSEGEPGKRVVSGQGSGSTKTTGAREKSSASARKSRAKAGRTVAVKERETGMGTGMGKKQGFVSLGKMYPDLPEPVRATNHLKREDIAAMQLFAGHLPISPNHVLPPPATDAQFASIFTPKPQWQKYRETVDQLTGTIEGLESAQHQQQSDLLSSEEPTVHLDNQQDPMAQYYRTNRPPPPPRPMEDFEAEQAVVKRRGRKGKSWQTTITVTEWMDGQGHRTFRADSSPIVRVPQGAQKVIEEPTRKVVIRQPFLERLRVRHVRWAEVREPVRGGRRERMMLISVKRQRKAKMKKHKLKKLRKRTRNLRRKLGKL